MTIASYSPRLHFDTFTASAKSKNNNLMAHKTENGRYSTLSLKKLRYGQLEVAEVTGGGKDPTQPEPSSPRKPRVRRIEFFGGLTGQYFTLETF